MINNFSVIVVLSFSLLSFAMNEEKQLTRSPDWGYEHAVKFEVKKQLPTFTPIWLREMYESGALETGERFKPFIEKRLQQNHVLTLDSMGKEADEAIDLVATTFIEAGGDSACLQGGGTLGLVELLIFGNFYNYSGIPKLAKNIFTIATNKAENITLADVVLFTAFTCKLCEEPLEHQFYYLVNKMKRENSHKTLPYYERLNQALERLPEATEVPTLYRFIDSSHLPRNPVIGDIWDMSLSSGSPRELTHFKGEGEKCIKFIMELVKPAYGRDISICSAIEDEKEFMFFNNIKFVITDIQYDISFNSQEKPQTMMIIRLCHLWK